MPIVPAAAALVACVLVLASPAAAVEAQITTWRSSGLGIEWHHPSNRVAYDAKGADGYYDIHIATPEGGSDRVLNAGVPGLPTRHVAGATWHASGAFVIAVAEEQVHPGGSYEAIPGFGAYNDLWAIAIDGTWSRRLTSLPDTPERGLIIPRLSADGSRLSWCERRTGPNIWSATELMGYWTMKIADVVLDAQRRPTLANVRSLEPGGAAFYEPYGFTPDGTRLIFAATFGQPSVWTMQIHTLDVATGGDVRRLTDNTAYNEHAVYTPDGRSVLWMSNRQATLGGCDWWMMDADGGNPRRVSWFNQPGHPHCDGSARWAGLATFAPDGRSFLGGGQYDLLSQEGFIKRVRLLADGTGSGLRGEYFARPDLSRDGGHLGADHVRTDARVDFDWGWGAPAPGIGVDRFSARWTGEVQPYYDGVYTFSVLSDDGVRLWVDGALVIDGWTSHAPAESIGTIALRAGRRYPIRLEYFDDILGAQVRLQWSSPQQGKVVIPSSQLYPTSGTTQALQATVDGRARTWRLFTPASAAGSTPLVIALHGAGGSGHQVQTDYNLELLASAYGFAVAYPDGVEIDGGRAWASATFPGSSKHDQAGIDDVAFIRHVIDDAATRIALDTSRVYACGLSSGGAMCRLLAHRLSDRIAAVATVGAPFSPASRDHTPGRPMPALLLHGTADLICAYDGLTLGGITLLGAESAAATWAAEAGFGGAGVATDLRDRAPWDATRVRRTAWGASGGLEVVHHRITGGGHTWPGSIASGYDGWLGRVSYDIDAAAVIWRFFAGFDRTGARAAAADELPRSSLMAAAEEIGVAEGGAGAGATSGSPATGCGTGGAVALIAIGLALGGRRRAR